MRRQSKSEKWRFRVMTDDSGDFGLAIEIADFGAAIGNLNPHTSISPIRNQQSSIANRVRSLTRLQR